MDSEEFSFRFDVGVSDPSKKLKFTDRERIVQSLATYFIIVKAKASIDQMVDGLSALGVLDMIRANPRAMRKLLVNRRPIVNADYLLNLFKPRLSAPGSNKREEEEQLVMYWVHFIEMIGGNFPFCSNNNYSIIDFIFTFCSTKWAIETQKSQWRD